ncbi:amino acid adenylation domain-containing protein [Streptomyces sp. NPDC006475]|uniref:non-ribosomal peptide synthetase n=1 Tax=Streptomyces sp. NPDC006475 TaxID=3155719 RepID=UPI0033B8CC42
MDDLVLPPTRIPSPSGGWNRSAHQVGTLPPLVLTALLNRQTRLTPDAPAVRDEDEALSYAQLERESLQLAQRLRAAGVSLGDRVACTLPRGVRAVAAQVAALRMGAVHMPVDPALPDALLAGMLRDMDARWLVSLSDHCSAIGFGGVRLDIDLPQVREELAAQPIDGFADPDPADPAYVVHTSGTSGRPKAVTVGHGAISHAMRAYARRYPVPVTTMALVSPMTVDACLAGIWWTLLSGGTVLALPADPGRAVARLAEVLERGEASHTVLTPSLYRQVLADVRSGPPTLHQIMVAGEACPPDLVAEHYRVLPHVELVNGYGPTEAAVWCATGVLRPGAPVTVGTAIDGVDLFVLSPDGRAVDEGKVGEIGIAGPTLADGYAGDAASTQERFAPCAAAAGRRVYRTGDRGRFRPDGSLEVLGRLDRQTKIRGLRVEPDGVAAVLRTHPRVRDAVVAAHDGRLCAYLVPAQDRDRAAASLRRSWRTLIDGLDHEREHTGWTSSYTAQDLPEADMTEWVDQCVRLARSSRPNSLLDLGCGTGLVLTHLARDCSRVVGIDVSSATLDALAMTLEQLGLDHVELRQGDAADTAGAAGFDLVLCNSVTPYFTDADHLARVLRAALDAAHPTGRVIFGDVKDLGLKDMLHAAVVVAGADDHTPLSALREQWRRRVALDPQLHIAPAWFLQAAPGQQVEIRPRRGARRNEMNDFRYDAVLSPPATEPPLAMDWVPWPGTLPAVAALLAPGRPVGVRAVPDARTAGAFLLRAHLAADGGDHTAGTLRGLAARAEEAAVHPEQLHALADEAGWTLRLSRASAHPDGAFDAAFLPPGTPDAAERPLAWPSPARSADDRAELTSDPLRVRLAALAEEDLLPEVRAHAQTRLAAHEQPVDYMVLTELPLTAAGKTDFTALPLPRGVRPVLPTPYMAPATGAERTAAEVFAEVLGLDRVGAHDDFVQLGGDSLLAVRTAALLGERLGVHLPSRCVFDAPTPSGMAGVVGDLLSTPPQNTDPTPDATTGREPTPESGLAEGGQLPLNTTQMLMWAIDLQFQRGLVAGADFTLELHYRIVGPLDTAALSEAVDAVVNRHPALRAALRLKGLPADCHQTVGPSRTDLLHVEPATGPDPQRVLHRLHQAEPLSLQEGRVFAAELLVLAADRHLLCLRVHHMVADAQSVALIEREIAQHYRDTVTTPQKASPRGHDILAPALLAPTPSTAPQAEDIHFWSERASGMRPVQLIPPTALPTPGTTPGTTRAHSLLVPTAAAQRFQHLARAHHCTPAQALYALTCTLIALDTEDPDVRLLGVSADRPGPLAYTVSPHTEAVLLRHTVNQQWDVADAITAAGATLRQALAHNSAPLPHLCALIPDLQDAFSRSQSVFFQMLPPADALRLEGCTAVRTDQLCDDFPGGVTQAPIDLMILAREEGSRLRLAALHDPACAPDDYVQRLLERLLTLVDAASQDDTARLCALVGPDPWLSALWRTHASRPAH